MWDCVGFYTSSWFFSWKEGGKFYLKSTQALWLTAGRTLFPHLEGWFESSWKQQMCKLIAPCFSSVLLRDQILTWHGQKERVGLSVLISQHSITSWTSNNIAIHYSWLWKQSHTAQDWEAVAGLYREPWWLHVYPELPWLRAQTEKTSNVISWGQGWGGVIRFTLPKARKSRSVWEEVKIRWYCLQLQFLSLLL